MDVSAGTYGREQCLLWSVIDVYSEYFSSSKRGERITDKIGKSAPSFGFGLVIVGRTVEPYGIVSRVEEHYELVVVI